MRSYGKGLRLKVNRIRVGLDKKKVIYGASILLIALFLASIMVIDHLTYRPDEKAELAMSEGRVKNRGNTIVFHPEEEVVANLVFYQGGLVRAESYAVLGQKLADNGLRVFIPKMPLNLAILNNDAFDRIYSKNNGEDLDWYIGGHSLGGSSASIYLKNSKKNISGIFFLGSYPVESNNIESLGIKVISIDASKDEIIDRERYEEAKSYLPKDTRYELISGGNHSNYGNYGFQRGDGEPTISREEQQRLVVDSLIDWISNP